MNQIPLDPEGVRTWLANAAQEYEQVSTELAIAKAEATSKELLYKEAFARSLLESTGKSREIREAEAVIGASAEHNIYIEARNRVTKLEHKLKAISKAIEIALALFGQHKRIDHTNGW